MSACHRLLFAGTTRWSRSARSESLVGQGSGNRGGVSVDSCRYHDQRLVYLGLSPPPRIPVANEGLGWDPLLKA